jgi:hypothetical protein
MLKTKLVSWSDHIALIDQELQKQDEEIAGLLEELEPLLPLDPEIDEIVTPKHIILANLSVLLAVLSRAGLPPEIINDLKTLPINDLSEILELITQAQQNPAYHDQQQAFEALTGFILECQRKDLSFVDFVTEFLFAGKTA